MGMTGCKRKNRMQKGEKAEKREWPSEKIRLRAKKLPGFLKDMFLLKILHRDDYKKYSRWQFDYIAEEYDRQGTYEMVKEDYPEILEELREEPFESLLDCGCGTGAILALLREEYPDQKMTGIDLSEKMIGIAEKRELAGVTFLTGDCENLPFADNSFDAVICSHSFHHYPHPARFFRSAFRVLKPGGRLILRDNTGSIFYLLHRNFVVIPRNNWKHHEGDVRFYSVGQVSRLCKRAGFQVDFVEERMVHKLHGVARKP